jgi:hypothetical protein
VVVDLGKAEVFKWQVAEAFNGLIGGESPIPDLLEQLS